VALTDAGFIPDTQADILERLQNFQRLKISAKLDLSERTVLGNVNAIISDELEALYQVLVEAWGAFDRDTASSDRLSALAVLLGVPRRGTTAGLDVVTLNLDAAQTYAAGDIQLAVQDEPDNTWVNRDAVTSAGSGNYPVVFVSELVSAEAVAAAGTLTVIPTPVGGLNSATNAADATPGQDFESDAALRVRMAQAVARGGTQTVQAIRSALVGLDGVLSVDVFENRTNVANAEGLPPHSIRAVVWDGAVPAADDDAIAQAIADRKAAGITSDGSESGTATVESVLVTIPFARPLLTDITCSVTIASETGVTSAAVKAALAAAVDSTPGVGVVLHKLAAAVFGVAGVDDYSAFTINGGSADLAASSLIVYRLTTANVTATGDVV
jgi:uncharacterized phage protein gp47/JayE